MKRLLAMAAALLLAFAALPAPALAATELDIALEDEFALTSMDDEETVFTLTNNDDFDIEVTIEVYDQEDRRVVQTMNFTIMQGDAPYEVKARVYKPMDFDGEITGYRYTIRAPGITERVYYAQRLRITYDNNNNPIYTYYQDRNSYFPRNTVSSFGPHFRDVTPGLTDAWYMFTPIDLTLQGRQTFVLVAGNMYEVGEAYVDVNMDTVNVSYRLFYEDEPRFTTDVISEFLTFFNSYDEVTAVEPEQIPNRDAFAFNRPFSIMNDLGGDTNVLMLIVNRITYFEFPTPKDQLTRFFENKAEYAARREAMLMMMDPITRDFR